MLEVLRKLIRRYITCKHSNYYIVKEIFACCKYHQEIYFEKRKCKDCGRIHYSDYYIKNSNPRKYFKYI